MTRFRKSVLSLGVTLALLLPLASTVSADPGDPGTTTLSSSTTTSADGRGGADDRPGLTTISDPGDPGTTW